MHGSGHEAADSTSVRPVGALQSLVGKIWMRHVIAGLGWELSAEEARLEFESLRKRLDRRHGHL
jgi:hypothetical protein